MSNVQIVRFFAGHECIADITLCQGLSDALAYIASGKAEALMVASLDQLTPSPEDLCRFAKLHKIGQGGPKLISIREQLDTRKAQGRLMLGVIEAVTRAELSERDLGGGHAEN
jgi:DNA invertase Pin-like site-specific DNA recombinase